MYIIRIAVSNFPYYIKEVKHYGFGDEIIPQGLQNNATMYKNKNDAERVLWKLKGYQSIEIIPYNPQTSQP